MSPVVVTVVGARPQFVKAAVVSRALAAASLSEAVVHTGQHYDPEMSDVFFEELGIPRPTRSLGIGGGTHGRQTGDMLGAIEDVLLELKPRMVLVYGDTNSTLAGALAASKLHIPIAHVEAGLRSFNRRMPEEINRVLTDHLSTLLFCPTHAAVENLTREGVREGVVHCGDVMYDIALSMAGVAEQTARLRSDPRLRVPYVLVTIHRAENTDDPERLRSIVRALSAIAAEIRVLLPLHPRTQKALAAAQITLDPTIFVVPPLGFIDMTFALRHAKAILTDSGGVQKEAYFHGIPCVTARTETEWVETVDAGWNRLVAPDDTDALVQCVNNACTSPRPMTRIAEYGDGHAARQIAIRIQEQLR